MILVFIGHPLCWYRCFDDGGRFSISEFSIAVAAQVRVESSWLANSVYRGDLSSCLRRRALFDF